MISKCSSSVRSTHAVLGELVDLAFDHAQRDVAQQPHHVERVLRERHRHRLDVEEVAGENRDVVPPARVHRHLAAPQLRVVDDVVVDERRRVDEFDDGGVEDGARTGVPAETRGHQQHGGADAFTAARLDVTSDFRDDPDLRLDLSLELAFDSLEIGSHWFEHLNQIHAGFRRGVHQARQSDHTGDGGVNATRTR